MDLAEARDFVSQNHRAILATFRRDGGVQLSPVVAGIDEDGRAVISSRETAIKTHNLRRNPRATLCAFPDAFYGNWVTVEGDAQIVSLPDAMEGLVAYYRRLSGEHPDWDEYRRAMERERRVLIRIPLERVGPTVSG